MMTIQDAAGKTIHTSQNLRGLNEHMRRALVQEVHIRPLAIGGGRLSVIFVNGDSCAVEFASYEVLRHWIARKKWLQGVPLWVCGHRSGEVNPHHTHLNPPRATFGLLSDFIKAYPDSQTARECAGF